MNVKMSNSSGNGLPLPPVHYVVPVHYHPHHHQIGAITETKRTGIPTSTLGEAANDSKDSLVPPPLRGRAIPPPPSYAQPINVPDVMPSSSPPGHVDGHADATTCWTYDDQYQKMLTFTASSPNREIGGDLFGRWDRNGQPIIEYVLGPGESVNRSTQMLRKRMTHSMHECDVLINI
jgi:hypothetical protein